MNKNGYPKNSNLECKWTTIKIARAESLSSHK